MTSPSAPRNETAPWLRNSAAASSRNLSRHSALRRNSAPDDRRRRERRLAITGFHTATNAACHGTTRRPSSFFVKMASRRALRPESTNGVRVTATLHESASPCRIARDSVLLVTPRRKLLSTSESSRGRQRISRLILIGAISVLFGIHTPMVVHGVHSATVVQ